MASLSAVNTMFFLLLTVYALVHQAEASPILHDSNSKDSTVKGRKPVVSRTLSVTDDGPGLEKDVVNPSPSPVCIKNVQSISKRKGACMPYHWTSYTKRTHTHCVAANEKINGDCGIVASDLLYNDGDLGWTISTSGKCVTVELRNYGSEFCFGDNDFGAGCWVARNVC